MNKVYQIDRDLLYWINADFFHTLAVMAEKRETA